MIQDRLENLGKYASMHASIQKVCDFIQENDIRNLPAGRISLDSDNLYINVDDVQLRPLSEAFPEVHDRYIDIQIPLSRDEKIGYIPRCFCKNIREAKPENDITFYNEKPSQILEVGQGSFVIFFPQDAHAPIIGEGRIKKIVAKIKI